MKIVKKRHISFIESSIKFIERLLPISAVQTCKVCALSCHRILKCNTVSQSIIYYRKIFKRYFISWKSRIMCSMKAFKRINMQCGILSKVHWIFNRAWPLHQFGIAYVHGFGYTRTCTHTWHLWHLIFERWSHIITRDQDVKYFIRPTEW